MPKATKITTTDLADIFDEKEPVEKKSAEIRSGKVSLAKKRLSKVSDLLSESTGSGPGVVVKKYGEEASEEIEKWLATESGFLEGLTEDVYGNPTSLYGYQIKYLRDPNFFIHIDKARQTGFSYVFAGRSLARSHLNYFQTSLFISINQEEANEKIMYARALYESLPASVKKKCVVDNKHSLEFEDHSGRKQSRTRIISHAQREPRGKGGNVDVYLDEAAHYTWGDQIYVAAVPIITRGHGSLTIGSSPLGKKGIHYEIISNPAYKKIYSYHQIFWWDCIDFVKKGRFKQAKKEAPHMASSEERIATFGSEKLIGIFISMDLMQFQQEYELLHVDEAVSFFPIDLINKCIYEVVLDELFLLDDEYTNKLDFPIMEAYPTVDFKLYRSIEDLASAVSNGKVSPTLYAGYDVGRKQHAAEFSILEEMKIPGQRTPLQVVRYMETFRNTKFNVQKRNLKRCLEMFPRMKMKIDQGGIGADMSEELSEYSWRVVPIDFTNDWKEETCSDFRIRLEDSLIALPNMKDLKNQIHSIKRRVTESGRFIFDAEKNSSHHGDKFWSIAMASSFGERPTRNTIVVPPKNESLISRPRIIPVSSTRIFTKTQIPKMKMPMAQDLSRFPSDISRIHMRGE